MKDFRYIMVEAAISDLGWKITGVYDDKGIIVINHCWNVSLADPRKIQFNILCLEFDSSDANKVELCVNMLNSMNQRIKLFAYHGVIIAASEIDTTSIMNDSFSMAQTLGLIKAEAMASAKSIQKLLAK